MTVWLAPVPIRDCKSMIPTILNHNNPRSMRSGRMVSWSVVGSWMNRDRSGWGHIQRGRLMAIKVRAAILETSHAHCRACSGRPLPKASLTNVRLLIPKAKPGSHSKRMMVVMTLAIAAYWVLIWPIIPIKQV